MKEEIINRLLVAKHGPFLSILVPLHKTGRERMQNQAIINRAISKAKSVLKRSATSVELMTKLLDQLDAPFKPNKPPQSVGLFVSPEISEFVCFPFRVTEKILVDDSFETRDLHYLKQYLAPYYTVLLTTHSARLFISQGAQFDEIRDGIFPMHHEDEYEYARPSFTTSVGFVRTSSDRDKSSVTKLRIEAFYREVISSIQSCLRNKEFPLVVAGTREQISMFASLNDIGDSISARVYGVFTDKNLEDAGEKAWLSLGHFRKEQEKKLIHDFEEKNTHKRLATGIQEVWAAANESRGKLLLVEKDYTCRSYLKDGDPVLYLRSPKGKYMLVPDVVDEVIETVIERGGHVTFTDNKSLRLFDRIVLELRY